MYARIGIVRRPLLRGPLIIIVCILVWPDLAKCFYKWGLIRSYALITRGPLTGGPWKSLWCSVMPQASPCTYAREAFGKTNKCELDFPVVWFTRRRQTCNFRKRASSVPAEGPAYGLDFARHWEFPLRALQAQRWHLHGSRVCGAAWVDVCIYVIICIRSMCTHDTHTYVYVYVYIYIYIYVYTHMIIQYYYYYYY